MTNKGVTPIDPQTEVGELRLALGDIDGVPLDPPQSGYLNYQYFSDAELEQLIDSAEGSIKRAEGYGLRKLARYLTMSAASITTDDLRIETYKRAELMAKLATDTLADADAEEARAAADVFEIVPFGGRPRVTGRVEGLPRYRAV